MTDLMARSGSGQIVDAAIDGYEKGDSMLEHAFSRFDHAGEGTIPTKDLAALLRTLGLFPTEDALLHLIDWVDPEGDGFIAFPDFLDIMQEISDFLEYRALKQRRIEQYAVDWSGDGAPALLSDDILDDDDDDDDEPGYDDEPVHYDPCGLMPAATTTQSEEDALMCASITQTFSLFDHSGDGTISTKDLAAEGFEGDDVQIATSLLAHHALKDSELTKDDFDDGSPVCHFIGDDDVDREMRWFDDTCACGRLLAKGGLACFDCAETCVPASSYNHDQEAQPACPEAEQSTRVVVAAEFNDDEASATRLSLVADVGDPGIMTVIDDATTFGDPTAYNIIADPDKCGYTKRIHLNFNDKGKNGLMKSMKPDNTVKAESDDEKIYDGSLKDDWDLLAPKELSDPDDKKPSDWVRDPMMDDPDDKKPVDWDDAEDGEYEAPVNDNLAYKGDCYVNRISNPAFKGIWKTNKFANPEFVDDDALYHYDNQCLHGCPVHAVQHVAPAG